MRLTVHHLGGSAPSVRTIAPVPSTNLGFMERREVRFQVPDGGPWTLRVDDEDMEARDAAWSWKPGFYAGEVLAQLVASDGRVAAEYRLDVSPDEKKVGRERFAELVREVEREDPTLLLGDEPATLRVGAEQPLDDPLVALARFARLRAYAPAFIQAIREAARYPRSTVRRSRESVGLHRVRHVDIHSVLQLARGSAISALHGQLEVHGADLADVPIRIDVPVSTVDFDGAANRCVVAEVLLVRQSARRVRDVLTAWSVQSDDSETRTRLRTRLPHRVALLDRIDGQLCAALQEHPWCDVTRPEVTAAGLNAIASDPLYARVHQLGWKALRTGLRGLADTRLWLSPTWEIFERWCFVRVAGLLRERFADLQWTRTQRRQHSSGALAAWVGEGGGVRLTLLLQPRFPAWDQGRGEYRSISGERYPDLLLTWESGTDRRCVVLDAKYSRDRDSVLAAMTSAHLYRDALRWHGVRPALALLLLPATPDDARWLVEPTFHITERVGALVIDDLPDHVMGVLLGNDAGVC